MTDRLESMSLLLDVVEMGSLSAVAKQRRLPLATISRKVAALERHIGASLLLRGQRRVTLTEAGAAYVDAIRPLLEQLDQVEQAAAGDFLLPQGELSVTAPILFGRNYIVAPLMEFLEQREELEGRLVLTNRHVNLREEGIDVAIRIGKVEDSSLIAIKIGTVRRIVCASPEYLQKKGHPRRPEDLKKHQAVLFEGGPSPDCWDFLRRNRTVSVEVGHRVRVNDTEAAVDGALAGLGCVRVFSYQVQKLLEQGSLVEVLRNYDPEPVVVRIVYADRRPLPRRVREFVDFCVPRLRECLSE